MMQILNEEENRGPHLVVAREARSGCSPSRSARAAAASKPTAPLSPPEAANSYPNHSTRPAAQAGGAGSPVNVMKLTRLINQMNGPSWSAPAEEAGSSKNNDGATCCRPARGASSCAPAQPAGRRSDLKLALALASSYYLLLTCAVVGQCAPTGIDSPAAPKSGKLSSQQHSHGQQHRQRQFLPADQQQAVSAGAAPSPQLPSRLVGMLAGEGEQGRAADGEAGALVGVQPVVVLDNYDGQSMAAALATFRKISERQQREGANISPLGSAEEADAESVAANDTDDEQILLVLASDLASPSANRRLTKRSGISDQRLAEIQMLRALKKQLEREASKIAADSNDGDDEAAKAKAENGQAA